MWDALLLLIKLAHFVLLVFILVTPFINIPYLSMLHILVIPSILLHWILNNNICSLTVMEKFIRNKISKGKEEIKNEDCFTCRLIGDVYDFKKNHSQYTLFLYSTMLALWIINVCKVCNNVKINLDYFFKNYSINY